MSNSVLYAEQRKELELMRTHMALMHHAIHQLYEQAKTLPPDDFVLIADEIPDYWMRIEGKFAHE